MTNGYFSAWYSSKFDPSGYVKGWGIAEAGRVIEKFGYKTYCIGAGGDILASSDSDKTWNIGIQDPKDSSKIINKLSISNGAAATSGNYQRGNHIINPKTARPAEGFSSVTVTGPDIITADILATAIFAMGKDGETLLKNHEDYQATVIE
jgi:thiamine biosynthesis lipoprotein